MGFKNRTFITFLVLLSALLLFACSQEGHFKKLNSYITDLKQTVSKNKKKNGNDELKTPAPIIYKADSLRTPFETAEALKNSNSGNPLQVYSLNMLKFIGTLTQDNVTMAYVMAPDNKLYTVKVGDMIGDHHGKVLNITSDKLEVMETESEAGSPETRRIVALQLKEEH